ncbi:TPA: ABC-2 transporter permease, partial [Clostridium perfringens]|nr:ABC-2 transporter permease [Clostridium perfringens]
LLIKDIFNILNNIKSLIFTVLILSLILLTFMNTETYIITMTIIFNMFTLTAITYDEHSNWDKYALTLPISIKDIIISKYILMCLLSTFGSVIASLIVFIISIFSDTISRQNIYLFLPISILITLFLSSFTLPIIYKYGVERSRPLIPLTTLIPILLGYSVFKIVTILGIPINLTIVLKILILLSPLLIISTIGISIKISIKIYKKNFLKS